MKLKDLNIAYQLAQQLDVSSISNLEILARHYKDDTY